MSISGTIHAKGGHFCRRGGAIKVFFGAAHWKCFLLAKSSDPLLMTVIFTIKFQFCLIIQLVCIEPISQCWGESGMIGMFC